VKRCEARVRSTRAALLAAALLVAACASLVVRNPPRIDVTGVALDRVAGADAWFSIDLRLTNRVDQAVAIEGLQGTLSIEGENVAQADLVDAPVRLPANGTATAHMTAHTGMDAIMRAVVAAMRRGAAIMAPGARPVLHYTLQGSATLGGGGRFPFTQSGEIGEPAR
jgi:hypothetical protein